MQSKSTLPSFLLLTLASHIEGLTTTNGPTAYVSINSEAAYTSIYPCAASCLWYQGALTCGFPDYYDLAQELQCGCEVSNLCYCGKDNLASASAYLTSCVRENCKSLSRTMFAKVTRLYDAYCATAYVEGSTTAAAVVSSKSSSTNGPGGANDILALTTASGVKETGISNQASPTESVKADEKKGGLTSSDVIALGIGLGVGVSSLVLGLATFCLQRKRKERKAAAAVMRNSMVSVRVDRVVH